MEQKKINFKYTQNMNPSFSQLINSTEDLSQAPIISNNYDDTENITNKLQQVKFDDDSYSLEQNNRPIKVFFKKIVQTGVQESLPVVSVIVTIFSGDSYDNLFREVAQKAPEGGRVKLYSCNLTQVNLLYNYLSTPNLIANIEDEELRTNISELMSEMSELEEDCVLFNFECCSGCSDNNFSFPKQTETLQLVKFLIDKGNMVMFSDFAIKALISNWQNDLLGLNPFINLGECSTAISLSFKPDSLKECPSAQLQMVGKLSEDGLAKIHALGGTIVFGVNQETIDNNSYDLTVLTIVTQAGGFSVNSHEASKYLSKIGDKKGTVGHAMIKYKKSSGTILLSAGHWIELSYINVNISNLETVANSIGGDYLKEMNIIKYSDYDESEKKTQFKSLANKYVQQSTPCNYSQKSTNNIKIKSTPQQAEKVKEEIFDDEEI